MGVLGLQKFMKEKCEGGFEPVNLLELSKLYRCEIGENPVIFYEMPSSIYSLTENLEPILGLKTFKKQLEIFINNFSELDINLKVVTDGLRHSYRLETWIEKQNQNVDIAEKLYSTGFVEVDFSRRYNALVIYLVANLVFQMSDKCEFIRAIYSGNEYIINHIKKNPCFAVLTNDSSFILAEGAQYCFSARNLDLNTMSTFNYNRKNLAKHFDISVKQLPVFGSLFFDNFWPFFTKNSTNKSSIMSKKERFSMSNQEKFNKVSELVKILPSGEEILQGKITDYQNFLQINKKNLTKWIINLKFFLGVSEVDVMNTYNKNWNEILRMAEMRHTEGVTSFIFQALSQQEAYLPPDFSNVLKPMPDSALLPLRKNLYGILFSEYPYTKISVTEHCYEYCEDIKKAKYICRTVEFRRCNHPGLLKMWSELPDENIQEDRRRVFFQALDEKLNPQDLKDIKEELLFPFLATFYLFWKLEIKLRRFEVRTLLIQAIMVNDLSEEEINKYNVEVDVDAIDLTMWFLKTVNHLNFLNSACGEPFHVQKTNLINFFDGKVLHHVYDNEKKAEREKKDLNVWNRKVRRKFQFLKEKMYQIGHKCGLYSTEKEFD